MRCKNVFLFCLILVSFAEFVFAGNARLIQTVKNGGYMHLGVHAIDGSYVTAALFRGNHFLIRKTNSSGRNIWIKHLRISSPEFTNDTYTNVSAITETADQGFVIAGETYCQSCSELLLFLIKVNQDGQQKWKKGYLNLIENQFTFRSLNSTSDGGVFLSTENGKDKSLIRFSPNGDILWKKGFALDSLFLLSSISTQDNGVGLFYGEEGAVLILKFDDSGNLKWKRRLEIPAFARPFFGQATAASADDGFLLAGSGRDNFKSKVFVIKLNGDGSIRWKKAFSEDSRDVYVPNISKTGDQGFIITATIGDATLFFKISHSGKIIFQHQINDLEGKFLLPRSTFEAPGGGYVSFGSFAHDDGIDGLIPEEDQVFLKLDTNGMLASCISSQPGDLRPVPFGSVEIKTGRALSSTNPITLQPKSFQLKSMTSTIQKSNNCEN